MSAARQLSLHSESKVSRRQDYPCRQIEGEGVVVNVESGKAIVLNVQGYDLWQQLDEPIAISGLVDRLCSRFDVSKNQATEDICDFVNELASMGLLTVDQHG